MSGDLFLIGADHIFPVADHFFPSGEKGNLPFGLVKPTFCHFPCIVRHRNPAARGEKRLQDHFFVIPDHFYMVPGQFRPGRCAGKRAFGIEGAGLGRFFADFSRFQATARREKVIRDHFLMIQDHFFMIPKPIAPSTRAKHGDTRSARN